MSESNGTLKREPFPADQPWNDEEMSFVRNWGADVIHNAYMSRDAFISKMMDPRRNYYDECGYPRPGRENDDDYYDLYRRDSLAARIVEVFPKECWQVQPEIYESEDEEITPFEKAWDELCRGLRGEDSWFKGNQGNPVWQKLEQADVLAGIGAYGVLVLGFDDVTQDDQLRNPVKKKKGRKLLSLDAFPATLARVSTFDSVITSPRRGLPEIYSITFNDPRTNMAGIGSPSTQTVDVHWTRVIHIVDNYHQASSSRWSGFSRLQPVLNEVLGDQKIVMTSPEAFWRACVNVLMLETHPTLGGDVKIGQVEQNRLKDMMERIFNGLERYGVLKGLAAKSVAPTVNDPKTHHELQMERISVKLGMPMRILKGSERGELSSGQDTGEWNARCMHRNDRFTTPVVIVPFVDRLIWAGCLPEPGEDGWLTYWPDRESATKAEKATVALTTVQALAAAAQGNVGSLVGDHHLLTTIMGFDERTAESMEQEGAKQAEEMQEQQLAEQEAAIERGLAPDPAMDQLQSGQKHFKDMATEEEGF